MAGDGKGVALGCVAAGGLLLYSGITNKDILSVIKGLIKGSAPSTATTNPAAVIGSGASSSTSGTTAPGDTGAASASAASNQALAKLSVIVSHPSWATGQQWQDWVSLWNAESGWNNFIQNEGSGAFGIAQALGHGSAGSAAENVHVQYPGGGSAVVTVNEYPSESANAGNALAQIQWGIGYIADTYGSPSAAWAHEESAGWY